MRRSLVFLSSSSAILVANVLFLEVPLAERRGDTLERQRQGYIPTLDGWRAIAILAVIVDHAVGYQASGHPILFAVTRIGPNGVSLFFAISGFLICSRLIEEDNICGRISLRGFYIRRAFRILPPAMTYLAFVGVLGLFSVIAISSSEWWSSVLFVRNYLPPAFIHPGWGGYTVHYWSLAVEEHFYLLWPAALVLSGPRRAKWAAASLMAVATVWKYWDSHNQIVSRILPGLLFGSRTDVRIDGLLAGCLAALILADPGWKERSARYLSVRAGALCLAAYVAWQVALRHHYYTLWESILLAVAVVSTVVDSGSFAARCLESRAFRWIGRLSYSLYLWQQFFLVPEARMPFAVLQRFPLNLVVLFGIAGISYRFIERPMIRLGHKLAPPPTPGRDDAVESGERRTDELTKPATVAA